MSGFERVDVVIVGARCAGSATAVALSERGVRVVALDSAKFPSDTLSTHLLWPSGLAEIDAIGALAAVEAIGAPRLPVAFGDLEGVQFRNTYTPVAGIDYGMCIRRVKLDQVLVERARASGADVREGCRVTSLVIESGRVVGVRYNEGTSSPREVRAKFVIGADGRRSTVAKLVGALDRPLRESPSGRACFFAYWKDGRSELRHVGAQWRVGDLLGTAFPCDDGRLLSLLQPPVSIADEFRGKNKQAAYLEMIEKIPGLAERLQGCELDSRVLSATDITSYFRRSSGPGWALPGDSGHFKDPVTAQGIRDAIRYGRLLGETLAPVVGRDDRSVDAAVREWAWMREKDCIGIYQLTNDFARGAAATPLEFEVYRRAARDPEYARIFADVFCRTKEPSALTRPGPMLAMAAKALLNKQTDRRALASDLRTRAVAAVRDYLERAEVSRRGRRGGLTPIAPSLRESLAWEMAAVEDPHGTEIPDSSPARTHAVVTSAAEQ